MNQWGRRRKSHLHPVWSSEMIKCDHKLGWTPPRLTWESGEGVEVWTRTRLDLFQHCWELLAWSWSHRGDRCFFTSLQTPHNGGGNCEECDIKQKWRLLLGMFTFYFRGEHSLLTLFQVSLQLIVSLRLSMCSMQTPDTCSNLLVTSAVTGRFLV